MYQMRTTDDWYEFLYTDEDTKIVLARFNRSLGAELVQALCEDIEVYHRAGLPNPS
jgi:hypothetical protein